ncbi:MAG: hypothetical protein ORN27_02630 [Rhodoluna sp.]|nr:hypothetical protein [Rhodoluna sp.]
MNNPSNILRALRRHGLYSWRIVLDRMICWFAAKGLRLNRRIVVAKAAARLHRWKLSGQHWNRVRLNNLNSSDLHLMATALLRNLRWQDALNLVDFATKVGRSSIRLELDRVEALWRLKDHAGVAESRARAIAMLENPTAAEISLINNENQVINIPSRLDLLWMTEPHFDQIRARAEVFEVLPDQEPKAYVYWGTGFATAPNLIKNCQSQARTIYGDKLVQLDANNIGEFLGAEPQLKRVEKLWPANYSDAIRVGLLARHGGVWLDATIFTTENSLGKYLDSDLFTFSYNGPRIASWFMSAKAGSYQARLLYAAMLDYWSRNRKLKNYFLFHDFFEVLYHLDPRFRQEFDSATHLDARPSLIAHNLLWKPNDPEAFEEALKTRPIQKLTYKPGNKPHGEGTTFEALNKQP